VEERRPAYNETSPSYSEELSGGVQLRVSLADCVVAETARSVDAPVATSDPHLLDLCHDEGIAVLPVPDSGGRTWSP